MNLFQIAKKMLAAVSEPIEYEDRELHLTASIGIALYPEHGRDAEISSPWASAENAMQPTPSSSSVPSNPFSTQRFSIEYEG